MKWIGCLFLMMYAYLSYAQIVLGPTKAMALENQVKEVRIYKTKFADTASIKKEYLSLQFFYDTLGRRTESRSYYMGKVVTKEIFYYEGKWEKCLKQEYVVVRQLPLKDTVISVSMPTRGNLIDCQTSFYSYETKYKSSYNIQGMLSNIISYSKLELNWNYDDSGSAENVPYSREVEMDDIQYVLRVEYVYY